MCVFFPLALLLAAAPWPLGVPVGWATAWDALLAGALGLLIARMRRAPTATHGQTPGDLSGRPCPACGGTETSAWMNGGVPVGLICAGCGRRSAGV